MFDKLKMLFKGQAAPGVPRVRAAVRPAYQAGSTRGPRTVGWQVPDVGANAASASAPEIRKRCRAAVRNDSWARAIVETLVDDCIGWGLKPLSRAEDEPFRQKVQRLWESWTNVADADGVLDLAGLQSLALREMVVAGEAFIRLRGRLPEDKLPVPLQVQVLPAEICPQAHSTRTADGNEIREGIEYNGIGKRVAYWFREVAPGEDTSKLSSGTYHRVPANQVLHLFEPLRPGQRWGVSALAPALVRLDSLDHYSDATLERLTMSTLLTATLEGAVTGADDVSPWTGQTITKTTDDGVPLISLTPGSLHELAPGEKLSFNDPPPPPEGFSEFADHQLRAAGASVGVPFEAFSHSWGRTNDRLARIVLNQYRRRIARIVWSILVHQFLDPLWRRWFSEAIKSKALPGSLVW